MAFDQRIPLGTLLMATLAALYIAGCGGSAVSENGPSAGSSSAGTAAGGGSSSGGNGAGGTGHVCNGACPLIACGAGTKPVLQPGACCSTCVPDDPGGTSGATGSGGCSAAGACLAIGCAVGYIPVVQAGDCCPTCVPDGSGGSGGQSGCANMSCPALDCVMGFHLEVKPGDCCASCVAGSCQPGQQGYAALKQQLLQPASATSCKVNTDCAALSSNASCGDQCGVFPVNVTSKPGIDQQLSAYAQDNCSSCMAIYPPCALLPPPICVAGQCMSAGYL